MEEQVMSEKDLKKSRKTNLTAMIVLGILTAALIGGVILMIIEMTP